MPSPSILLHSRYFPGLVGKITELHAVYYHAHWGFDVSFECQVARELSEFMSRPPVGADGFWVASLDSELAGFVAVDGRPATPQGARLRWFIVGPEFQNLGIGGRLLSTALDFCSQADSPKAHLWTFRGLEAARRLYEAHGFKLTLEKEVVQWGGAIREQLYEWELAVSSL